MDITAVSIEEDAGRLRQNRELLLLDVGISAGAIGHAHHSDDFVFFDDGDSEEAVEGRVSRGNTAGPGIVPAIVRQDRLSGRDDLAEKIIEVLEFEIAGLFVRAERILVKLAVRVRTPDDPVVSENAERRPFDDSRGKAILALRLSQSAFQELLVCGTPVAGFQKIAERIGDRLQLLGLLAQLRLDQVHFRHASSAVQANRTSSYLFQ